MRVTAALLVLAAVGLVAAVVVPVDLAAGALAFPDHDRVVELDAYGPEGTTAVGYVEGVGTLVEVPLVNAGRRPVTITGVDPFPELLGMVGAEDAYGLPVTLAAGEATTVQVRARFANCAYYTERAVNWFRGAEVEVTRLGLTRTVTVPYPREVVLRSPTILRCPDRVLDRSARQRMLARDD